MNDTEYRWTTRDNVRLYAKSWEPDFTPNGVINLVHDKISLKLFFGAYFIIKLYGQTLIR